MLMCRHSVIANSRSGLYQRIAPGLLDTRIHFGGREAGAEVASFNEAPAFLPGKISSARLSGTGGMLLQ